MSSIKLTKVTLTEQRGRKIYTFPLSAKNLIRHCRIERFGEDAAGVQRKMNEGHVIGIAEAMADPTSIWLDPIVGDLRGTWKLSRNTLTCEDGEGYICVDDGQHRILALKSDLLSSDELDRLVFMVTVTMGMTYEQRLRVFRMQAKRRGIDRRLDLEQRHRLNEWEKPTHADAYKVILDLNSKTLSPLRGRVQITEGNSRPYARGAGDGTLINAAGLFSSIVMVFGRRSPLSALSATQRMRVVMDIIRIASEVWARQWDSRDSILTTARGVNALLRLFVSGPNFRAEIGRDFSEASLRRALECGSSFNWHHSKAANQTTRQISDRLDDSIRRGALKAIKAAHAAREEVTQTN